MNNTLSQSKSNKYFRNSPIRILKVKGISIIGILFLLKFFEEERGTSDPFLLFIYLFLLSFLLFKEKRKKFRYLIIIRSSLGHVTYFALTTCFIILEIILEKRYFRKKITLFHFLLLT